MNSQDKTDLQKLREDVDTRLEKVDDNIDTLDARMDIVESAVTNHLPTSIKAVGKILDRRTTFIFAALGVIIGLIGLILTLTLRCLE